MAHEVAPRGLNKAGRELWNAIVAQWSLRADELQILEEACGEVDLIAKLNAELRKKTTELTVRGSQGQPVANPLIQEVRQHRMTMRALLAQLKLPDDPAGAGAGGRSAQARDAAGARWQPRGA